jgi:hypothetical protein
MGIFQLMDYVGIDICHHICHTMSIYLPDPNLQEPQLDRLIAAGIIGGQHANGTQKEGLFRYEKNHPVAIYSLEDQEYHPLQPLESLLGKLPSGHSSWKVLHSDPHRSEKLKNYFHHLYQDDTRGAALAKLFLAHSRALAHQLVKDGVAKQIQDVEIVLKQGFYHLYGPEGSA